MESIVLQTCADAQPQLPIQAQKTWIPRKFPKSTKELEQTLYQAIEREDISTIRKALEDGADPQLSKLDRANTMKTIPLGRAIEAANPEIVRALLEYSANPDLVNAFKHGRGSIRFAVKMSNNIRDILSDHDYQVEREQLGAKPFKEEDLQKMEEIARLLSHYGAPVDQPDDYKYSPDTALNEAVQASNLRMVQILKEIGSDFSASVHEDIFFDAASTPEVFKFLLESGAAVNRPLISQRKYRSKKHLLFALIHNNHPESLKILLEYWQKNHQMRINELNELKILEEAVKLQNPEIVKFLLAHNFQGGEWDLQQPLLTAIADSPLTEPQKKIIKLLLYEGADPNSLILASTRGTDKTSLVVHNRNGEEIKFEISNEVFDLLFQKQDKLQ